MLASVAAPVADWPAEFANALVRYEVRQNPAAGRPPDASTNARTRAARCAGVAAITASSTATGSSTGLGGVSPGQPGSGGARWHAAAIRSTRSRSASATVSVVDPLAVRPSRCSRSRTVVPVSATFWWMYEFANRVRARLCRSTSTSASVARGC